MYFRIDPTAKWRCGFSIDLITVELESRDRESESVRYISADSDDVSFEIVGIGYEGRRGFSYDRHSRDRLCRGDFYPFSGFEYHPIIRSETGCGTENLFLSEFIVYIHGSICIFCTHLIDRSDIECVLHRYFQSYRPYIHDIFTIEHARFFLRKNDISRYGLDSKLRRYRHIGFRDREIEYEGKEREGSDEPYDEEEYIGIFSDFFVFIEKGFLLGKEYKP